MKLFEFIRAYGYTRVEDHLKLTVLQESWDPADPDGHFHDVETNVCNVVKFRDYDVEEFSEDLESALSDDRDEGDTVIRVFLSKPKAEKKNGFSRMCLAISAGCAVVSSVSLFLFVLVNIL